MFKKLQFVEYMVDVKGYSNEEATELWKDIGGDVEDVLCRAEISEMAEFVGVGVVFAEDSHFGYAIV